MRKITIYQEGEVIELYDDDSSNIDSAIKEATKMFYSNNISVLQANNTAFIVRPSKLNSILIEEIDTAEQESLLDDTVKEIIQNKAKEESLQKPIEKEIQEDIITDVE